MLPGHYSSRMLRVAEKSNRCWRGAHAAAVLLVALWTGAVTGRPRVLLISVDGLRPDAITAESAPNLAALRDTGVSVARALSDLPAVTLPNHTSMLTGLAGEVHGVVANITIPGFVQYPTIFQYARIAGLRSAFFASKEKLKYLAPPQDVETVVLVSDIGALTDALLAQLTPDGPDLIFAHLRDPDTEGHAHGWMTPEYLSGVQRSDVQIGRILTTLQAAAQRAAAGLEPPRPTYVLVSADHGGLGKTHGMNVEADRRIPWILGGPDLVAGLQLEAGTTLDTAPTALWLLGVPIPETFTGQARTEARASGSPAGGESPGAAAAGGSWEGVPPVTACVLLTIPAILLSLLMLRRMNRRG